MKKIAIFIFLLGLIIIGCGQKSSVGTAENTVPPAKEEAKLSDAPFHCNDLLPDSDFERLTGKSAAEYKVQEKVKNIESGGKVYGGHISCLYAKDYDLALSFLVGWSSFNGKFGDSTIGVEGLVATGVNNAKSMGKEKEYVVKKIENLGSTAYSIPGFFLVASSNKKYTITMVGGIFNLITTGDKTDQELNGFIETSRIIDQNLNKY